MGTSEPPNNQSDQAARDAQWVREVYRPHDPQLTVRAVFAGMFVGAIMSLSNVYVVLKTGWSLGVTLTSCVIAFAVFELLHAMRLVKRPLGILENNAVGSVASAAGFIGSLLGFGVIGPWLYAKGAVHSVSFGTLVQATLWPGAALLVSSGIIALVFQMKGMGRWLGSNLQRIKARSLDSADPLDAIECP